MKKIFGTLLLGVAMVGISFSPKAQMKLVQDNFVRMNSQGSQSSQQQEEIYNKVMDVTGAGAVVDYAERLNNEIWGEL